MAKEKKIIKKTVKKKTKVVAKKTLGLSKTGEATVKKIKSSKPRAKAQKEKKDLSPEIIFDSRVGKTDALFVDEPQTPPVAELPIQISPETPEFKIPELQPQTSKDQESPSLPNFSSDKSPAKQIGEAIKKWWQKLFKI